MIARLSGKVLEKNNSMVVLDVGGVGYEVQLTNQAAAGIEVEKSVVLHIAENIKDDTYQLFGFVDGLQRTLYYQLNGVSGVGPKAAMSILSAHTTVEIEQAIIKGDTSLFSNVSGIGRKTASRIILELKGKLEFGQAKIDTEDQAYLALLSLGYSAKQAATAVRDLPSDMPLSTKVTTALKELAK